MNIQARITSRKVIYSYIYSYIVKHNPFNNETRTTDLYDKLGFSLQIEDESKLEDMSEEQIEEYCVDILQSFFSYRTKPEIDMSYVREMIKDGAVMKALADVEETVDPYTKSFSFNKMDVSDQALFTIAILEMRQMGTPKEVLINEMVELAKRYGDVGSPKLINGILHKLLNNLESETKKKAA